MELERTKSWFTIMMSLKPAGGYKVLEYHNQMSGNRLPRDFQPIDLEFLKLLLQHQS